MYYIGYSPLFVNLFSFADILWLNHSLRYGYYHDIAQADLPYVKIPLHTVIKLTPKAYGCDEERYDLLCVRCELAHQCLSFERYPVPIKAVDTHRPKPGAKQPQFPLSRTGREYFADHLKA